MSKKRKVRKPRTPFWRTLRALSRRRIDSARVYRRSERKRSEREALRHAGEDT